MDLQIKSAAAFSNQYLDKVYNLLKPQLDQIRTEEYKFKYDQMLPFFQLFSKLRKLTEDLSEIETVDLIEELIIKKNLIGFSNLNFIRTLYDLRLCILDDIVELKSIKVRDFLVKLRYLYPFYQSVIDSKTDLHLDYLEQSAYLQKKFLNLFPKLGDSFYFLVTCDLEVLDKLNLEEVYNYKKIHRKLSEQIDETEDKLISSNKSDVRQIESSYKSEDDCSKQKNQIKLNESDKILFKILINEKMYVVKNHLTNHLEIGSTNREELIIGEINFPEPENKMGSFISASFEGKHKELMLLSMKSTINVINSFTFEKLQLSIGNQIKSCLVDLAINGVELGLQHAYLISLNVHFGFVKIRMPYFYFDELEIPIKQNLIGTSFIIEHVHSLLPYNYFTLKEEPEVKHLFLNEHI